MIIIQESNVRKTQLDPEQNAPVATSSTPLIPPENPPAYTPRENYGPSSSSVLHPNSPSPLETRKRPPTRRAAKRFFKALGFAFALYFAIALGFRFLWFLLSRGPPHDPHRIIGRPDPEDGRVIQCITGGDTESSPVRLPPFNIPLDSSAIFVLVRGKQAKGRVAVELDPSSASDKITVDITAQYRNQEISMGTAVCLMEREEGELGVGIYSPRHHAWKSQKTQFEITVKIPRNQASSILELPRFEIIAPEFPVTFPNIDKVVHFHDLVVHTAGAQVDVDSVRATNIDIRTSDAAIYGTFITNSSLALTTSNAPITMNVLLENNSTSGKSTSIQATTTNEPLTGSISLLSDTEAPRFKVRADTTNAGLNLSFPQSPDSSDSPSLPILDIIGSTTRGPAELRLPSSFEGTFDVSTNLIHNVYFSLASGSERDPLGLGRRHEVQFTTNTDSRKEGRVYWGNLDDGRELGSAKLSTSNNAASLLIQ